MLTVYELLKRCLQRPPDEVAWQEFVNRYHAAIKANVAKTFRLWVSQETEGRAQFPDELIEVLVQAVYVRLVKEGRRALDRFEDEHENSIFRYLGIISINVVRDYFRKAKAAEKVQKTTTLGELRAHTLEKLLNEVTQSRESLTVILEEGHAVVISPGVMLKALPELEGRIPEGWKDAIYGE